MGNRLRFTAIACSALLFSLATPVWHAHAVLSITGNGNTTAPPGNEDPGFAHVGTRAGGGLTLIYLGNGWVLTANHVGASDLRLGSVVYPKVLGSSVRFVNENGSKADLVAFKIFGAPRLPDLPILEIAPVSPQAGMPIVMIGHGYNRGLPISWSQPGPKPTARQGWHWGGGKTAIRWGTNRVEAQRFPPSVATHYFTLNFSRPGAPGVTPHEAHAVVGDSGGAVFARSRNASGPQVTTGNWELAGVLFRSSTHLQQPARTAMDGNRSLCVDLARFRDQIIPLVRPECSDEVDNDRDGRVDYPEDPGCATPEEQSEQ